MKNEGVVGDFLEWNNRNVLERPDWVNAEFTKEFSARMLDEGIEYCALESLYGPDLAVYMKNILGASRVIVVYISMDIDTRLQRQMIRQNLSSLDEAKKLLLPRDEIKKAWKVPEIEKIADVIIDNSGTLDQLYLRADAMLKEHCQI
jgi:hypothetical protein